MPSKQQSILKSSKSPKSPTALKPKPDFLQIPHSPLPSPNALPFAQYRTGMLSPHVHFPPTPSIISSTHQTFSPNVYDRAPIRVVPNECQLPERSSNREDEVEEQGSYFQPRAYESCTHADRAVNSSEDGEDEDRFRAPSRTPSSELLGGESDESDLGSPQSPPTASRPKLSKLRKNSSTRMPSARPKMVRRSSCRVSSSFSEPSFDDGCLGGF